MPLTISSVQVTGDFRIVSDLCTDGLLSIESDGVPSPAVVHFTGKVGKGVLVVDKTSLNFGTLHVGEEGSQTITLQNTGTASITLGAFTQWGGHDSEFTYVNTCGATLEPGGRCTIDVKVKATLGGTFNQTLQFSHDDYGSAYANPLGISMHVNEDDPGLFLVSNAYSTIYIDPGSFSSYSLTLAPKGEYSGRVTLGCSVAGPGMSCILDKYTADLTGNNYFPITATVNTHARNALLTGNQRLLPLAVGLTLPGLMLIGSLRRRRWLGLAILLLCVVGSIGLVSCGGGGGSSSAPVVFSNGTPAGSYPVEITATSGSYTTKLTFTAVVR